MNVTSNISRKRVIYTTIEELENNIDSFIIDLRDNELSKSTLQVYKTNINQFINYLKTNKKNTVNKSDYQDYRDYMKEG